MIEDCRDCGERIDVRNTAKGTRMAISLEKEPFGTIELRESRIAGQTTVAHRVAGDSTPRYVEHSKACRGKRRGRR